MNRPRTKGLLVAIACSALIPLAAAIAEAPWDPEVTGTIAASAQHAGACRVQLSVKDPQSRSALAAPTIEVPAGEKAQTTSSDADWKVEIAIEAKADCAGGSYDVAVAKSGKPLGNKHGVLTAKQ